MELGTDLKDLVGAQAAGIIVNGEMNDITLNGTIESKKEQNALLIRDITFKEMQDDV